MDLKKKKKAIVRWLLYNYIVVFLNIPLFVSSIVRWLVYNYIVIFFKIPLFVSSMFAIILTALTK